MAEITTSLVVSFSNNADSDSVLSAEVDSRDDGYNNGNTDFLPGQEVFYLITKTTDVTLLNQVTSTGSVEFIDNSTEDKEEFLTFANESEASVSTPISGEYETKWLGNVPQGELVKTSELTFSIQKDGQPVESVAVLKITYKTLHQVWKLKGVSAILNGESNYEVVIMIFGENEA